MSYSSAVTQEQLDYRLLLLTHIVCADQQIHSKELEYLEELGDRANISQNTKDEKEKIFAQDEHQLTVDYIAQQIPVCERSEVMRQIVEIGYADGDFALLEREMVDHIAAIWNWSDTELERIITEVESFSNNYEDAIKQCAKIAQEDYIYAESAFNETEEKLKTLSLNLEEVISKIENKNSKAATAKEVAKQLEDSKQSLETEIIKKVAKVRESYQAKQRALNRFSIAFMGRTKAGKSTLHSIITEDGWDSIGVGKQRTTRFNRIYEWNNIRIIDTPGIGAAVKEGRTDEKIAKEVIKEADIICYVVTNDSIQEAEFQFLKLLKEQAKPLIIVLNIKYNLRDSRRLEHFLSNPDKLFALEGKSGIGGHIERIRRYAKEHYANNYFDIVPVMLLAAHLSSEPEHKEYKKKLYKASRIPNFLDSIRESIIKHGTIRRSQTFLGSTVGSIEEPNNWITSQKRNYQKLINILKNKRQTIHSEIQKTQKDVIELHRQQIEEVFRDAFNITQEFAEDYWDESDENKLNESWKQKLNEIDFEQRINNSSEEASKQFNDRVKKSLEEIGRELQLISGLYSSNFNLKSQDSFDTQKWMKIGGGLLATAGAVMLLSPPFLIPAMAITVIGCGLNWASSWFDSVEKKHIKAVVKISNDLEKQLKKGQQNILKKNEINLSKYYSNVSKNIEQYFNQLIQGLEVISSQLEETQKSLKAKVDYLNSGYAKRIIDWSLERYQHLDDKTIKKTIVKVERDFGKRIEIKAKSKLEAKKSLEEMKQVLQEDISIESIS